MSHKCDYCDNNAIVEVSNWNHYWSLCPRCLRENKKRFDITDEQINKFLSGFDKDENMRKLHHRNPLEKTK